MGLWICTHMPWHKFIKRKPLSMQSEQITCSCGRKYAMNHSERIILPWEDVRQFYEVELPALAMSSHQRHTAQGE